ncbi:MAG: branched-chain amino acid transporter AzlD [Clostridiales bacterium]|nr:branched-chain amino acid transporter AzlD [Clostridiales bacterium]
MTLTPVQTLIIIGAVTLGTVVTRFLPFVVFKKAASEHSYISYLGRVLPYAAIGLLVVYCLKGVSLTEAPHGIPEAIAIIVTAALHFWKGNTLLSIGAGTVIYMVLVNVVFT